VNGEKSLLNEMPSRDILAFVNLHDGTALRTSSHKVQVYVPPGTTVGKVVPPVVRVEHSALENH
jgi:hypothetical protein